MLTTFWPAFYWLFWFWNFKLNDSSIDPSANLFWLILCNVILPGIVFLLWIWNISVGLKRKVPKRIKTNLVWFKIVFFSTVFYAYLVLPYFYFFRSTPSLETIIAQNTIFYTLGAISLLVIMVFLLAEYCARIIKSIEIRRPVSLSEYGGLVFLILFFPLGIWLVQPSVHNVLPMPDDVV